MKWEEDLVEDIHSYTEYDDRDNIPESMWQWARGIKEVSDCNYKALEEHFLKVRNNCTSVVEIGVDRNAEGSFTHIFLKHKLPTCTYFGIDIADKSYLNNHTQQIYTIQRDSSDYYQVVNNMKSYGIYHIDVLFIDGYHSINQVLRDWEYTKLLRKDGLVVFHDVNHHPGPKLFIGHLDPTNWETELCCPDDFGIGFAWRSRRYAPRK